MPNTVGCTSSNCTDSSSRGGRIYNVAWLLLAASTLWPAIGRTQGAGAQAVRPGSVDLRWDEGAPDCGRHASPPIEVRRYDDATFILRESLCATFEAPFMYLLLGSERALLIDTGDVAEPAKAPLAATVLGLLPVKERGRLPLVVAHTHRHLDHRAGDPQFEHQSGVRVVPYVLAGVRQFYGFNDWPIDVPQLQLGGRVLDVIATPGHDATHLVFYDRNTALLFSGDFLLPGRLLIDDTTAERASVARVVQFLRDRPLHYVFGGHIELNRSGELYDWGSSWHPQEHALPLGKQELLALPDAVRKFDGFYARRGGFIMMNSLHCLLAAAGAGLLMALAALWALRAWWRRRQRTRAKLGS